MKIQIQLIPQQTTEPTTSESDYQPEPSELASRTTPHPAVLTEGRETRQTNHVAGPVEGMPHRTALWLLLLLVLAIIAIPLAYQAGSGNGALFGGLFNPTETPQPVVVSVYLFYNPENTYSTNAAYWLIKLKNQIPLLQVSMYEVWGHGWDQSLDAMLQKFGLDETSGVPIFFVGQNYAVGYTENSRAEIIRAINECLTQGCPDAGEGILTLP